MVGMIISMVCKPNKCIFDKKQRFPKENQKKNFFSHTPVCFTACLVGRENNQFFRVTIVGYLTRVAIFRGSGSKKQCFHFLSIFVKDIILSLSKKIGFFVKIFEYKVEKIPFYVGFISSMNGQHFIKIFLKDSFIWTQKVKFHHQISPFSWVDLSSRFQYDVFLSR